MEENAINPETGRDMKGRFAKGNSCGGRKRKPSEVTSDIRQYADVNNLSLKAVKRLEEIMLNKGNKFSENAQIRASELLIKHLTISAEKDVDKQIADEGNKTIAEMFDDLKGIK